MRVSLSTVAQNQRGQASVSPGLSFACNEHLVLFTSLLLVLSVRDVLKQKQVRLESIAASGEAVEVT